MIREINKDISFLSIPSTEADENDIETIMDLKDTLDAKREICVGLAANMIGVSKRIIAIMQTNGTILMMVNPEIIKTSPGYYETSEGCLSLEGERPAKRYNKIKVAYLDEKFKKKIKTFIDFEAQIIQHEIDHCNGIII